MDMKLADYLIDAAPSPDMNYQGVLIPGDEERKSGL